MLEYTATKLIDTSIRAQLDDPRRGDTEHVGLASGSFASVEHANSASVELVGL
jgi:hypothetical protein